MGQLSRVLHTFKLDECGNYMKLYPAGALVLIAGMICILAIPPSGLFITEFLIFKALFSSGYIYTAIAVLIMLTIILYIVISKTMHLLFAELPENFKPEAVFANRFEPVSQFVLFFAVIYMGFNPPPILTELINQTIQLLN